MTPKNRLPDNQDNCGTAKTQEFIRSHPDEAVLLALAAGAAVGVALAIALGGDRRHGHVRRVAEGLGERLVSSLERVLPDSIGSSLGLK